MIEVYVEKNTGNDATAIQKAVDFAHKNDIGKVIIPEGDWQVNQTILLHSSICIVLDGATVNYNSEDNNVLFKNSCSGTPVGNRVYNTQRHITISGRNGGKIIGGCILLTNSEFCTIKGIIFEAVSNFAIILASVMAIKVYDIQFVNCKNGVVLGTGTRDCFLNNISGSVEHNFMVIGDYLYEQFRRNHRYHVVFNNIIRNVNAKAQTLAYLCGRDVERIVFSDIKAEVDDVAFNVKQGKHICFSGLNIKGNIINDDLKENTVCFVD